jgi:LacI family transcriptional regulator
MATTIRDIARLAGVCIGTVSRVLNDMDKVHPETRERIRALIAKTGYRPSAVGRALATRRTRSLLLQVTNVADPYYARLSKLAAAACRARGYNMILRDADYDPAAEAETLRRCRDGAVDGLLLSPLPGSDNLPLFREVVRSRFPFVLIDNDVPGSGARCVKYDDCAVAAMAVDRLAAKGHRRVAFLAWHREFPTVQDRIDGWRGALRRHGLPAGDDLLVTLPADFQAAESGWLEALLRRRPAPTALLAENEIVSIVCMNALVRLGRRIPEDVAVIGVGDALIDPLLPVPLTTVSLGQEEACRTAVDLLLDLIERPKARRAAPRTITARPFLVEGRSA